MCLVLKRIKNYLSRLLLDLTSDDLYSYFTIEQNTGIICPAFSGDILSNFIVNSTLSYVDQFSLKTCYNLIIFASTKILTIQDLQKVAFENTNCSFSFLKICTNKIKVNFRPPEFRKTNIECEKSKLFNKFYLNVKSM